MNFIFGDFSEDSNAKYEVYVPDGRGEMAQQLLTLPEIRTLLARQADNPADSDIISLENGKVSFAYNYFILKKIGAFT